MPRITTFLTIVFCLAFWTLEVEAANEIEWVVVGDPGNLADPVTTFGGVDYTYRMGKFEVTAGQYSEFLNAVASTEDTFGLYAENESRSRYRTIDRIGTPGDFSYSPTLGLAKWPVTYVSFWEALRYANWLHNGKPSGLQDETTTEDGAYTLTLEAMASNTVGMD